MLQILIKIEARYFIRNKMSKKDGQMKKTTTYICQVRCV